MNGKEPWTALGLLYRLSVWQNIHWSLWFVFLLTKRQSWTIISLRVALCLSHAPVAIGLPCCWQHGWLILATQLIVLVGALQQVQDSLRAGIPPWPMLAQAFPLYQERPCPITMMPSTPGWPQLSVECGAGQKARREAAAGRSTLWFLWSEKTGGS